jgi:phosphoglycerate dehydrogenase-like enzyme
MTTIPILHSSDAEAYAHRLAPLFPDVRFVPIHSANDADAMPYLAEADAIFSLGRGFTAECLAQAKKLRWYHCIITGTEQIAPMLANEPILLTNSRGMHGPQMSELAILHMMMHYRQIPRLVHNREAHKWEKVSPRVLDRRTVVIVGVGAIAERVATVCKAFGMTVVGVSRTARPIEGFDEILPRERLQEAAARADFLLLIVPYSKDTHHIVDEAVLNAMKPTGYLINIARGGVVDEAAMIRALKEKRIAGAGLDVFEHHFLPPDSELWDLDNVFITPLIGGHSDRYVDSALEIIEPNLRAFLAGRLEDMTHVVSAGRTHAA